MVSLVNSANARYLGHTSERSLTIHVQGVKVALTTYRLMLVRSLFQAAKRRACMVPVLSPVTRHFPCILPALTSLAGDYAESNHGASRL
jgi:hypothetical protein